MVLPNMDLNNGDKGKLKDHWDSIIVGILQRGSLKEKQSFIEAQEDKKKLI